VARIGDRRVAYRALVEKPEGKGHLKDPGVDGRIILNWIFSKSDGEAWTGLIRLRVETSGGLL
jgi:hypothetical protein